MYSMEKCENVIRNLFDEFEDNCITVSDFDIHVNGARVDCLVLNEVDGSIGVWCGNPFEDDNCEELVLSYEERENIYNEIMELF